MAEVVLEAPLTHSGVEVEGVGAQGAALRWHLTSRAGLGPLPALPRLPGWLLWTELLVPSVLLPALLPRVPWPEPQLALGQHWGLGRLIALGWRWPILRACGTVLGARSQR